MGKNKTFLFGAIMAALAISACTMPSSLKIKSDNGGISLPVPGRDSFSLTNIFRDMLGDQDMTLSDIVDLDTQTFLVARKVDIGDSIDLEGQLGELRNENVTIKMDNVVFNPSNIGISRSGNSPGFEAAFDIDLSALSGSSLTSMTLGERTLTLDFGSTSLDGFSSFRLSCPELGFENVDGDEVGETVIFKGGPDKEITFTYDPSKKPKAKISFDYEGGTPPSGNLSAIFNFEWTEATVSLAGVEPIKGDFPKEDDNELLNFGDMGDFLHDFALSSVEAQLFLSGPRFLRNAGSTLKLDATWDGNSSKLVDDKPLILTSKVPDLPKEITNDTWSKKKEQGIGFDITKIMKDFPGDLVFSYEVNLGNTITVTPNDLEADTDMEALLVLELPLALKAGKDGGSLNMPEDIFDSSKDIFGREKEGDSLFGDVNITSVSIAIDFDQAFFKNATLHLEKDTGKPKLFPNGIPLDDAKNNRTLIRLNQADLNKLNDNLIFPEVRFQFPGNAELKVPRTILPNRITITGSGSMEVELPW